jgi:uncharacterized RDD family membrane protein YckC
MAVDDQDALVLETAEGVHFRLPLAGPISRLLAWCVDLLCVLAAASLFGRFATWVGQVSPDAAAAVNLLLFFTLLIGYSMILEWKLRGQTLGKRVFGLRVVDSSGLRLTLSQIVVRNLLRVVDMLPAAYAIGGLCCLVTKHWQRLGDLAANTVVIHVQAGGLWSHEALSESIYNSIRQRPQLVARLRQSLSPEEARLALDTVLRKDQLDPEARAELFGRWAFVLKKRVRFPPESLLGLSDERLVINVVESLFSEKQEPIGRAART